MNFKKQLFNMARQDLKVIVFPEASFSDKVIQAIRLVEKYKIAKIILIGDESALYMRYSNLENDFVKVINPKTSELSIKFIEDLKTDDKYKLCDQQELKDIVEDAFVFSALLVKNGYADGVVGGVETATPNFYNSLQEFLGKQSADKVISSSVLFVGKNKKINHPLLVADCSLMQNPSQQELVEGASNSVDFWKMMFISEPKVAFLSNNTNTKNETVISKATEDFKFKNPSIIADGEMQLDVALNINAQEKKFENSRIKGDANILIAPNALSGNILAKSIAQIGGLTQIGLITHGFLKPVANASRTCTLEELVLLIAITAIQAQE